MTPLALARRSFSTVALGPRPRQTLTMGADWPLLRSLPEEDRRRVLAAARRRRFARREVLFHEGDPGDTLHLIDKGRVALRIATPLGDVATIGVLGRGDVVGEMAVLEEGGRRGATVIALEPTETLSIDRAHFLDLRRRYPAVDLLLFEALMAHVRRIDAQLMEALFVPVDRRVVRRLQSLADIYASVGQSDDIDVTLTQDDLASLAGTSRATVNRVLRQAEEAGALSLSRGRIRVTSRSMLANRGR
ncbi:MAG TPA: Crp/Fnr family transcriptional regulator [Acidimicrobiia bacterium]|nr:Crp/Fnr family transcriptional regulator [Acidimicrobiia bacterium]